MSNTRRVRVRALDVSRLYDTWCRYNQIVLAVDFDDTLKALSGDYYDELINASVEVVKRAQSIGAKTVVFTSSKAERYSYIRSYCDHLGIRVDEINKDVIKGLELSDDNSKIYYNILLDDKAGLPYTIQLLESVCELMEERNDV